MHQLHLQETYLDAIATGTKTVEGRLLKLGKYDAWQMTAHHLPRRGRLPAPLLGAGVKN